MVRAERIQAAQQSLRPRLILTVTRRCNLRCSYCPTVKMGFPDLSPRDAARAVTLFADHYVGEQAGDVKLFGGEPLLVPEVVRAAVDEASGRPEIGRIYLSTNGLGLSMEWLTWLRERPKVILTLSMDGSPQDHRRSRLPLKGVPDAYDHILSLLEPLRAAPRLVVTQTIAPATAVRAAANFDYLLGLGFTRFNLLPGYFLPWSSPQLASLATAFHTIRARIIARWATRERLYLRNLFTWAPTPFFNTGLVVDSDGSIHPSNVGLSGQLEGLRDTTAVGSLDDPPTKAALAEASAAVRERLPQVLPPRVWESTLAVDALLSELCRSLYPAWAARRRAS